MRCCGLFLLVTTPRGGGAEWVQDKKVQGAAKRVRREDEMTMTRPFGPRIGSSSAWADTFRPSLGPTSDHFMSRITFLSRTRAEYRDKRNLGRVGGLVMLRRDLKGNPEHRETGSHPCTIESPALRFSITNRFIPPPRFSLTQNWPRSCWPPTARAKFLIIHAF